MAKNAKQTNSKAATAASSVLKDKRSSTAAKTAAASALAQKGKGEEVVTITKLSVSDPEDGEQGFHWGPLIILSHSPLRSAHPQDRGNATAS